MKKTSRNSRIFLSFTAILTLLVAACGGGGNDPVNPEGDVTGDTSPDIAVRDAWIREAVLPQGSPAEDPQRGPVEPASSGVISALYLALENNTDSAAQLTGVETGVARVVEMHQNQNQNGLMQMRPVQSIEIPAGGEVVFEPGGFHIMLIDVDRLLESGDEVAVTLIFNTGERLELSAVPVREA